jgi:CBS domain-containing protein
VSGAQVLELLTDGADEAALEPAPALAALRTATATPPRPAPAARRATVASVLGFLPDPSALVARARDASEMIGTIAGLVREPNDVLPFNRRLGDRRAAVWTTLSFDDLHAIRGRVGCKLNDVVLAIVAGALHRYLESHGTRTAGLRVRSIVPVSVRRAEEHLQLGNLVSAMLPTLPVGEPDPIARLHRIASEMQELKVRGQPRAAGLLLGVLGSLPAPFEAVLGMLAPEGLIANTVCTNVPGPARPRRLLGRDLRAVHAIAPLFQSMGLEFAILSYADTVSISATADPDLVPDLSAVADALEAAADELLAATRGLGANEGASAEVADAPRVVDLMSRDPVTVGPDDSLLHAHQLMRTRRIRHLPVLGRDGRLTGIVTMRDVMAAASSSLEHDSDAARVRILATGEVGEAMETHVCTASPGELAAGAGERMVRLKIGCLPVVGEAGRLLGIVTEEDFVHWATRHMVSSEPPARWPAERAQQSA